MFNWVSNVILAGSVSSLLRFVIGHENTRQSLNQSDANNLRWLVPVPSFWWFVNIKEYNKKTEHFYEVELYNHWLSKMSFRHHWFPWQRFQRSIQTHFLACCSNNSDNAQRFKKDSTGRSFIKYRKSQFSHGANFPSVEFTRIFSDDSIHW